MSTIVLESIRIPVLQVISKKIPVNEEMLLTLQYTADELTSKDLEYIGKCRLEMCIKAESDSPDKSFSVIVEIRGRFRDKSGCADHEQRKDAVMKDLLPHANATMGTVMALAKVPPALIPESVLAEFDD